MKKIAMSLIAVSISGFGCLALWGAGQSVNKAETTRDIVIPAPLPSTKWMRSIWTADDRILQLTKQKIDKEANSGVNLEDVVARYKKLALLNISSASSKYGSGYASHCDSAVQYGWAYAAQQDFVHHHTGFFDEQAYNALCVADPENSYEYTRLRFILTQEANPNKGYPELEPLGKRLLQRNPSDAAVRKNLIYALADSSQSEKALPYALAWTKQSPVNADAHFVAAYCYQNLMFKTLRGDYADKAKLEYQQYLNLEPINAPDRAFIQNLVDKALPESKKEYSHLKIVNGMVIKTN